MSNFKVQTQKDIDVINSVVELSVRLLVGKNDIKKRREIKNEFFRNITALTVVPYGGQGKWITMQYFLQRLFCKLVYLLNRKFLLFYLVFLCN